MTTLTQCIGGTTLFDVVKRQVDDPGEAGLFEVGVGNERFVGLIDYDLEPEHPVLMLELQDGSPVVIPGEKINYVRVCGSGDWTGGGRVPLFG